MARPYDPAGLNLVHGIMKLPDTFRAFWELERSPDNQDYIISEASFTKMVCDENELVRNGDLELTTNTKYWDTWGEETAIDLVSPGYGGTGNALRAYGRTHLSHAMAQIVNTDCVKNVGDRLAFSARIKFELNGQAITCKVNSWSDSSVVGENRCSDLWMYTYKAGVRDWKRFGYIYTDEFDTDNGW